MEYVTAHGARIPQIGMGTMTLKEDVCVQAVKTALQVGYTHLDTAAFYGNEKEVGEGLRASGPNCDSTRTALSRTTGSTLCVSFNHSESVLPCTSRGHAGAVVVGLVSAGGLSAVPSAAVAGGVGAGTAAPGMNPTGGRE